MATLSNLTLCYEGVQRVYRNAVVAFLRRRLTAVYSEEAEDRLKRPFKKEWPEIESSAAERRDSGEVSSELTDSFDLLGVNHFFNLLEAEYDALFQRSGPPADRNEKARRQAVLSWARGVKSLRDPLSHPSDEDFSYEDSFVLLDSCRRLLLAIDDRMAAETVSGICGRLHGQPLYSAEAGDPLEDNLPSRDSIVSEFVGRESELRELREWFDDSLGRRWALSGDGGKGKTAIAYAFAEEIKFRAPKPFQMVIWLSAKKRRFLDGVTVDIARPDFDGLDSALDQILLAFGWAEALEDSQQSKENQVIELLDSFPALLVVDDVDSLEGTDEESLEFFSFRAPQTNSKVLMTSRRQVFGMGKSTTHVGGLTEPEARRFVEVRIALLNLDPKRITEGQTSEIIEITEGSPLYLEEILRLIRSVPPQDAIRRWRSKGGDEVRRYALGRELDLLTDEAKALLAAVCLRRPIALTELESITGFSDDLLLSAIGELHRLFLISRPTLIEGEERYDINLNTLLMVHSVLRGTELLRRIENATRAVAGELPRVGRGDIRAVIRQAVLFVRKDRHEQAESALLEMLTKYPNDPDLIAFLGWVYKCWNPSRVTDAREQFKRAYQLKCRNVDLYEHWSRLEADQREWTKAAQAAESGLRVLHGECRLHKAAGYARGRLARELDGALQREKSAAEFAKSIDHYKKALRDPKELPAGERRVNADAFRGLVLNYAALKDWDSVTEYLSRWRREHPDDQRVYSESDRLARHLPQQV